jgi:predicted phage terminase large subunit-like protein
MVKASWNEKLINELRMFPNGAHDDIVDALSDGFNDIHGKSAGYFGA